MTATDTTHRDIRTPADIRRAKILSIVYLVLAAMVFYAFGLGSEGSATFSISRPGDAVQVGDINLDGRLDIVHSTEPGGDAEMPGVAWLSYVDSPNESSWSAHDISGPQGAKFDRMELLDLDDDGDLDVLSCEERDNLGVFWYENPTLKR